MMVSGEQAFMQVVSTGMASMYVSLDVYDSFFNLGTGIYTEATGSLCGGHAVALIGYGIDDGVSYWTIQNSWGTSWADNGYGRIKRGVNLAGIEENGFFMSAWVDGGTIPPCFDGVDTGLSAGGPNILCEDAPNLYGNLCTHSTYGDIVTGNCPMSCGACPGGTPGSTAPGGFEPPLAPEDPTPAPTPAHTESTTPAPTPAPDPAPAPASRRQRRGGGKGGRR